MTNVPCGPGFGLNEPSWAETAAGPKKSALKAKATGADRRLRFPRIASPRFPLPASRFPLVIIISLRNHGTTATIRGLERGALLGHLVALRLIPLDVEENLAV